MDFQAYNKILICSDDIKNIVIDGQIIGFEFCIKYPSYRGAFLSCIEELKFKVDGIDICQDRISFGLNNKQFLIDELPECFKEYWFVRDKAVIRVLQDGGLERGDHQINVYMRHRVPYTGYFGQYLVLDSDVTETRKVL